MNSVPLAPFLASLATDGIRVTLHDYTRISLALHTDGPWTVARLQGVLLALLVQDAEQEAAFVRRFESFFSSHLEPFSQVDLERALQDLRTLAQGPMIDGGTGRANGRIRQPEKPSVPRSRVGIWIALAVVVVLGLTVWLYPRFVSPAPICNCHQVGQKLPHHLHHSLNYPKNSRSL
jgi:hypothetical protein